MSMRRRSTAPALCSRFGKRVRWSVQDFSDRAGEQLGRKWFLKESARPLFMPRKNTDIVRKARHEQNAQVRLHGHEVLRQLSSPHAGHDHVCQEQIEAIEFLRREEAGLQALLGFDDPVA